VSQLVLSLFPGIGLLDMAFELEGFTVVRGPDVLWGGDVRKFHPPAGKFDGVIGGPPCQVFSAMTRLNPLAGEKHGNLIPEFERCVREALPRWFVMENVPGAPVPFERDNCGGGPNKSPDHYYLFSFVLNNRQCANEDGSPAVQNRTRRITFGNRGEHRRLEVETVCFESQHYEQAVTQSARAVSVKIGGSGKVKRTYTEDGKRHGPSNGPREAISRMLELQGVGGDWLDESPFTNDAKRKMIGNGVPIPMGRAIARAVKEAIAAAS
jgi:DNA (cytosine-5)-methyltransferase 1